MGIETCRVMREQARSIASSSSAPSILHLFLFVFILFLRFVARARLRFNVLNRNQLTDSLIH
jgi:hypothetical protein